LIDAEYSESVDMVISEEKIQLTAGNQKSNIFFCAPQVVTVFGSSAPKKNTEYFIEFMLDDNFMKGFNKIRKIGMKFGKVYFNVANNMFNMEATDKLNPFSNGLRYDLCKSELLFDYKRIMDVMAVIGDDFAQFKASFTFVPEQRLGMVYFEKQDLTEKYYLLSKIEN
jgi:hypothetical protein